MKRSTVIITGAARGIGKSVAQYFASKDFNVVVADNKKNEGISTTEYLRDLGYEAIFVKTDVSLLPELENLMRETIGAYGSIDVLINNAGLSEFYDPLEISMEKWNRVLSTNLQGVFFASREAVKFMKETGGGSIVNIASTRALMSEPNSEAYAASKGGILGLTHAMAASFAKYKVTVNAILPGWIETGDYNALKPADHSQHLSGRVGKPDDIARACFFLSSPENNFITGTQLVVDGGMTRKMIYEE